MKTFLTVSALALASMSLCGCYSFREAIGMEKNVPDEFAVVARAPLAVPPDFAMRPPQPGAPPTQEVQPQDRARSAVFHAGQQGALPAAAGDRSNGEGTFLHEAGADSSDPQIRQEITHDREVAPDDERSFADELLFWRPTPPLKSDQPVDANKEAERIKQAQAQGKGAAAAAQTTGPAPTIERKSSTSILDVF